MGYLSCSRMVKLVREIEREVWDVIKSDRLTATDLPLCLFDTNFESSLLYFELLLSGGATTSGRAV